VKARVFQAQVQVLVQVVWAAQEKVPVVWVRVVWALSVQVQAVWVSVAVWVLAAQEKVPVAQAPVDVASVAEEDRVWVLHSAGCWVITGVLLGAERLRGRRLIKLKALLRRLQQRILKSVSWCPPLEKY
jgi:hypothetical protein